MPRYEGFFKYSTERQRIALIGCGSLGSYTALFLSKCEFPLYLIDGDIVKFGNFNVQYYDIRDRYELKITRLEHKIIHNYCFRDIDDPVITSPYFIQAHSNHPKIIQNFKNINIFIITTDSIQARRNTFKLIKETNPNYTIIIDARSGGAKYEIFTIIPETTIENTWKYSLSGKFNDEFRCGFKELPFGSAYCATLICRTLMNYLYYDKFQFYQSYDFLNDISMKMTEKEYVKFEQQLREAQK